MAKSVSDYQTAFQNFMEKGARYYACPTGTMLPFAGKTVPAGFLLCNGAAISRTTYARLFRVLGTTWGEGDGSTTFNLPNVNDRCLEGTTNTANVGKYLEAGLPDITGSVSRFYGEPGASDTYSGCFYKGNGHSKSQSTSWNSAGATYIKASLSSGVYAKSTTNQPPSFQTLIIVKI